MRMRSSKVGSTLGALLMVVTAACGSEPKPPRPPPSAPVDTPPAADTSASAMPEPPPPPSAAEQQPHDVDPTRRPPLPPDKGEAPKLTIVALTISFPKGMLRDSEVELKKDGSLLFDGTKVGKVIGNKATMSVRPNEVAMRSDGWLEQTSEGYGKGFHAKMTDDTITNYNDATTQVKPDGSIVVTLPGQPPRPLGTVTGNLKAPGALRTAVFLVGVELFRPPDFSAAKKQADEAVEELQRMDEQRQPAH